VWKRARFRDSGARTGYSWWYMERTELISQITSATSPNDMSSAMSAARSWLADHPEDDSVRTAIQSLAQAERERLR
jgi:hypothetical protein